MTLFEEVPYGERKSEKRIEILEILEDKILIRW